MWHWDGGMSDITLVVLSAQKSTLSDHAFPVTSYFAGIEQSACTNQDFIDYLAPRAQVSDFLC